MNVNDQIATFREIIEANYLPKLLQQVADGNHYLEIDFSIISRHDPILADYLLDHPKDTLKAAQLSITQFDIEEETAKLFKIRIINLSEREKILIRDLRSPHLNRLITIEGTVRQKSDVRPKVMSCTFECPACGGTIKLAQDDQKFKEPKKCISCGFKGKCRLLSKDLVDAQGIVLEESSGDLEGGEQPKRINIYLENDLVSPITEKKTNPGSSIRVVGTLTEVQKTDRQGGLTTKFDLVFNAISITPMQEDYSTIKISAEEEQEIITLSKDPQVKQKLVDALAPGIYGHEKIKESILLQFLGGVTKTRNDGVRNRGDMHILLVGDPGAGKCMTGDTRIMLSSGKIVSMQSLVEEHQNPDLESTAIEPIQISSLQRNASSGSSSIVRVWKKKAPQTMLKIKTATGTQICVTKNHPLFTTQNSLIYAQCAEDFSIGDMLCLPAKVDIEGSLQEIPITQRTVRSNNQKVFVIPKYLTTHVARIIGYLVGDGYVRQTKTSGVISFTNKNIEILDDFEWLLYHTFGLNVSKRVKGDDCFEYYTHSQDAVKMLSAIDKTICEKSTHRSVSSLIAQSPNDVVADYLRALFECEGHINKNKREIEFSSISNKLITDMRYLLLRFGILCQVSTSVKCATNTIEKRKVLCWRLRICGEQVNNFAQHVGFISSAKNDTLRNVIESKKKYNTNIDVIPGLTDLLTALRRRFHLKQSSFPLCRSTYQHYERGDRSPSRKNARILADFYCNLDANDVLVRALRQIAYADVFFDTIVRIEEISAPDEFVYDLEVQDVHNFYANGIVAHNSQLLKRCSVFAPKSRYVSGRGASGAGLTAAVVRDEFMNGWALEAGALVLANKGIALIDELDKMSDEDRNAMHEALEQQSVTISKANIQATLRCETSVLAAANPKMGRFDPFENIAKQINLPPSLINRFDLIFPIRDLPDEEKDQRLASFVLNLHQKGNTAEPEIDTALLRKYIVYARKTCFPVITNEALQELQHYFVKMRNSSVSEGSVTSIGISARQLEGLVRMTEASAKIRFSPRANKDDALTAIALLEYCLQQIGIDPETGKIDVDKITTGFTSSQRRKIIDVREIIKELEEKMGKEIPIEKIIDLASQKGMDADKVEEALNKLKLSGDIYEPKRNFISRI